MSATFQISGGDVMINGSSGRPNTITSGKKLRQDINEFFTISVQKNGFGAGIEQLIGVVEMSSDVFVSLVYKQIRDGFTIFQNLQTVEPRIPRPNEEKILAITYLRVEQDNTDPTKYWFRVNMNTADGKPLSMSTPFVT